MERRVVAVDTAADSPEQALRDFLDYLPYPNPFPHNAVREPPPPEYKARPQPSERKARKRWIKKMAKAAAKERRLGPPGWEKELDAILKEHNWRHASKPKGVSHKTRKERKTFFKAFFKTLYRSEQNFQVYPRNLGDKHVRNVLGQWVQRGLKTGTLQVYLSHLRTFCEWTDHPGMVLPLERYLSDPELAKRTCVAREDKSWTAHGVLPAVKFAEIRAYDARVALWLLLCLVFGARLKEVLMLRPHLAEIDRRLLLTEDRWAEKYETYLEIKRGTKGGRLRFVPIDTPEKRAALEEAKRLVKSQTGHLGDPTRSLYQNMRRFKYVCEKFGITKAKLGITIHGLRHQYAAERYEKFAGTPAPVRGGAPVAREVDRAARLQVADELGHSRENVTGAYLGGILKQPAPARSVTSAPETSSSEPVPESLPAEDEKAAA